MPKCLHQMITSSKYKCILKQRKTPVTNNVAQTCNRSTFEFEFTSENQWVVHFSYPTSAGTQIATDVHVYNVFITAVTFTRVSRTPEGLCKAQLLVICIAWKWLLLFWIIQNSIHNHSEENLTLKTVIWPLFLLGTSPVQCGAYYHSSVLRHPGSQQSWRHIVSDNVLLILCYLSAFYEIGDRNRV